MVFRTETHVINSNHRLFNYCDEMCFKSKNLYNRANYLLREHYNKERKLIPAFELNKIMKVEESFKALPAKTSQQIIIKLCRNWKDFFQSILRYKENSNNYKKRPNLPRYKDKNGRNIVFFDYQQIKIKEGKFKFQNSNLFMNTNVNNESLKQIRIVPFGSCYKIEVVYDIDIEPINDNGRYLGIDLGLNNLATLTSNIGLKPIIINGRIIKSFNNYYNKQMSKAMSYVNKRTSKRMQKLTFKHNNIINTHMHKISRYIINYCLDYDITNIVIGNNDLWKYKKRNMQGFIYVPYEMLIDQLTYKAENEGIKVIVIDERYTSKSSFIDNDPLPEEFGEYSFSGRRIKRGLYKSKNGILINADVNGSYNILRKCIPEFKCDDRIKAVAVKPIKVNIT